MSKRIVFASVMALFTLSSSLAFADDCTWSTVGGTMHGACKDATGNDYCLSCPSNGGLCSRVPCPTPASSTAGK